ncbi:MAG: YfaZ family outer membrane protein [Gammaproteobacteria bacterium]
MHDTRWLIAVLLTVTSFISHASEFNFDLSSDTVDLSFTPPVSENGLQMDFGLLHNQDEGSVAAAGLHVVDDATADGRGFIVGLGGKLFVIDSDRANDTGGAIGVGAHFRYVFPSYNRISVGGEAYYAPDILAFADTQEFLRFAVRGEYAVLRQARVFLGYRKVASNFKGTRSFDLDNGLHVGLNIEF